jgi:Response regulator containing a CheY-like receiver domain and an HD-GYP domain
VIAACAAICLASSVAEFCAGVAYGLPVLLAAAVVHLLALTAAFFLIVRARRLAAPVLQADAGGAFGSVSGTHVEENFNHFISIIENLESNEPFKNILQFIYDSFSAYIPYTHIGVALITDDVSTIRGAYCVSGPQHPNLARRLSGYRTDIHVTSLLAVLQSGKPRVINDLVEYLRGKEIHEYNRILLDEGVKSSITFPLIKNDIPIGIIFFSSDQKNIYRPEHIEFLKKVAESIMLALDKKLLMDEMVVSSTLALATLAEERDNETGMHLDRMRRYTTLLAELLARNSAFTEQIDTDYITGLDRFSPLHDIGKVAISDSILLKPAKLTTAEFSIMKTHTTYGGKVLRLADENVRKQGYSIFGMGIEITEGHHERWDGSGYPYGRGGESIPLSARIVAVADVFDALASKRPYKQPFSFEDTVALILSESGTHFDPRLIEVFSDNLSSFKTQYKGFSDTY